MPRAVQILIATVGGLLGLVLSVAAVLLVVAVVDGRAMAFMIEKAATVALGRAVEIGRAEIAEWAWPPTIELTEVSVENAAWAEEPSMFRAERIRTAVAVTGLFPPSVAFPRAVVTAPAVSLAVNAQGEANWQGLTSSSGASSGGTGDLLGLRSFRMVEGSLTYREAGADGVPTIRLHGLRAQAPDADAPITFEGEGRIATGPSMPPPQDVRFSGEAGSLRQSREGDLPLQATASVGTAHAKVAGRVSGLFGTLSADLRVSVQGEDLQPLLALAGAATGSTPPFRADAHIVKQGARWEAQALHARLGESEANGTLTLDLRGPKPTVAGDFVATSLALDQLRDLGTPGDGQERDRDGGERRLPFEWLHAVNADLTVRAPRIEAPGLPLRGATVSVVLNGGKLLVDPLRVGLAQGTVTGTLRVDATADPPTLAFDAAGRGVPVGVLPVVAGPVVAGPVDGTVAGTVGIRSQGRTVEGLLANATGTAEATVDGEVRGQPMHLTLRVDAPNDADAAPVELSGEIGTASVRARGTARLRGAGERLVLHVHSEGPEVGALLALAGVQAPPQTPAYSIDADLRYGGEDARVRATGLQATVGDTRVEGRVSVDVSGGVPMVRADLTLPRLALDSLRQATPSMGEVESGGGQVIPPVPLPFDALRSVAAEATVRVGDVAGTALPVGGARVDASLRNGVLRLDRLRLEFADGVIVGTVTADANPSPPALGASIDLDAVSMDAVMSALRVSKRVQGRVNGTLDLRSDGRTLQDLSENLDGTARFFVTEGQFTTRLIDAMAVSFGEALGFLFSEGEVRPVDCVVGRFDIENGLIDPKTMVFVTPDMVLRGKGQVDLGNETIDLTLVPRPKERRLLDITVPVDVRGPLADPRIDIGVSLWSRLAKEKVCQRTLGGAGEDQARQ